MDGEEAVSHGSTFAKRQWQVLPATRTTGSPHPGKLRFALILHNPAVTGAIAGWRNSKVVRGVVGAATFRLSSQEFDEIGDALHQEVAVGWGARIPARCETGSNQAVKNILSHYQKDHEPIDQLVRRFRV